ncbi:MAG: DUF2147 domain-containing protein [Hyphomicrobium sp.]
MTRPSIHFAFLVGFIALLLQSTSAAIAGQTPIGIWMDHSGRGAIEIQPCGDKLCGHLVWMRDSEGSEGCGAQIIGEARQVKNGLWDNGWIYSPEKNRKYDVELKPLANGSLRVKGYAGTKMFSRTMIWKPAPPDLELCQNRTNSPNKIGKQNPPEIPKAQEKIAKANPAMSTDENSQVDEQPILETKNDPLLNNEEKAQNNPKLPLNTSKNERTFDDPSSSPKPSPLSEDRKSSDKKFKTAQSGFSTGSVKQSLDELQRQTGFGIKKIGNGSCRLKVPFVTIRIRCDD